jgi:hypothetical protein
MERDPAVEVLQRQQLPQRDASQALNLRVSLAPHHTTGATCPSLTWGLLESGIPTFPIGAWSMEHVVCCMVHGEH